ncbi:MAG: hypothetical protein ABIW38_12170, partial [Ferruginibacter sp.]
GFEPTVQFNPYDDLANRSFRPLRHLSFLYLPCLRGSKNTDTNLTTQTILKIKIPALFSWKVF